MDTITHGISKLGNALTSSQGTGSASLKGQNVLITGASMGIGAAIAKRLAHEQANLILFARSADKLQSLAQEIHDIAGDKNHVIATVVDVTDYNALETAIKNVVDHLESKQIDVLINNAGLALGAPAPFPDLKIEDVITMTSTNINGYMFTAYAVLNAGKMKERKKGTILNITSTTGLEVPPFPGEAVYHSSKAAQEAFTNVLRTELQDSNIKVLALRPGVVATHFHEQRVGYDMSKYDEFMQGFEPLVADDVAEAAAFMLSTRERVSVKALDVVPTAQRSLQVFDRKWNERSYGVTRRMDTSDGELVPRKENKHRDVSHGGQVQPEVAHGGQLGGDVPPGGALASGGQISHGGQVGLAQEVPMREGEQVAHGGQPAAGEQPAFGGQPASGGQVTHGGETESGAQLASGQELATRGETAPVMVDPEEGEVRLESSAT